MTTTSHTSENTVRRDYTVVAGCLVALFFGLALAYHRVTLDLHGLFLTIFVVALAGLLLSIALLLEPTTRSRVR